MKESRANFFVALFSQLNTLFSSCLRTFSMLTYSLGKPDARAHSRINVNLGAIALN